MAIRITFDSNNIDINVGENGGLKPVQTHKRYTNEANSGRIETLNSFGADEFTFAASFDLATYYKLRAFWSYARQHETFSFAMDSTKTGNTTLDGAAAADQTTIPVTSESGFSDGDICLIENATDDKAEVVVINGAPTSGSIEATSNLYFAYVSGDSFRHLEYWPSLLLMNDRFDPKQSGQTFFWTFKFREQPA